MSRVVSEHQALYYHDMPPTRFQAVQMTWWRVVSHYFVAGIAVDRGVVVEVAPILRKRYPVGTPWSKVRWSLRMRGFHATKLR